MNNKPLNNTTPTFNNKVVVSGNKVVSKEKIRYKYIAFDKNGKQIKIIFEITDGASSFPGAAKEAVQELLSKNVEIYAFQMGKSNNTNEKIFNFVWNEGYKEPHGIMIGEQIERLPKELLKAVGKNMQSVFDNY